MKEKQKSVPSAAEPKQNEPAPEVQPAPAAPETVSPAAPKPLSILDFAKDIPEDKIKIAEQVGIPLRGLIQYLYQEEQTNKQTREVLNEVVKAIPELPKATVKALQEMAEKRQAQMQQQPQPQGGGEITNYLPILQQILGAGGGSNLFQAKMENFMGIILDKATENILHPEKPLIQKYLEEETAKKIAKSLAAEMT